MDYVSVKPRIGLFVLTILLAFPAMAEDPYAQPDDTWISISGSVEAVSADAFTLNYGEGVITVEMDDGDRDADAYKLIPGDKVTVSGMIDDDFYETTTIEASSVTSRISALIFTPVPSTRKTRLSRSRPLSSSQPLLYRAQ